MPRLALDFRKPKPGSPWWGRALAVIAAAFAVHVGFSWKEAQDALVVYRAQLARVQSQSRATPAAARVSPEEIELARDTVERLGTPWEKLFAAIESAANDDVALAGIEPDPKSGTVLITGEGKSYLAALTYVLNLQHDESLSDVKLVRHVASRADPEAPVTFAVSARWSEKR